MKVAIHHTSNKDYARLACNKFRSGGYNAYFLPVHLL